MIHLPEPLQARLADQAIRLWQGHSEETARWLGRLGCTVVTDFGSIISVRGVSGIVVGIHANDPIDACVMLGYALFGEMWAMVAPEVLTLVKTRWSACQRAAKVKRVA